jgi:glutaredoxin 3
MPKTELFGTAGCPYTQEMSEWLEWQVREATGGQTTVPVLVEDGGVVLIGWQGRGCISGGGNPG